MTIGARSLRSIQWAFLVLAAVSGASFAGGDLFDDDYSDCPSRTRLRNGQIANLSVSRDSDDEDEVNVSWSATDPASWGLGPNTYRASLVVILDDGDSHTKTLSLGSRKATFTGIRTGIEAKVQMAIVVDTAYGDYLISDILEHRIDQSLTKPAFMTTDWRQGVTPAAKTHIPGGTFYYVGYNEAFGNYKAESGLLTRPHTPRLRIGLAHGGEDDDKRNDVDFDAYVIRITDEDGNVVPEGNDVATMASNYGTNRLVSWCIVNDLSGNTEKFVNVRVNDGGAIAQSMYATLPEFVVNPDNQAQLLRNVVLGAAGTTVTVGGISTIVVFEEQSLIDEEPDNPDAADTYLYAMPPDEHRDFPIDVLASDETYTITAWAVNDNGEVISPVASLRVRPIDTEYGAISTVQDYVAFEEIVGGPNAGTNPNVNGFTFTEFTVLK